MKKKTIKLNEAKLRNIIRKVIRETADYTTPTGSFDSYAYDYDKALEDSEDIEDFDEKMRSRESYHNSIGDLVQDAHPQVPDSPSLYAYRYARENTDPEEDANWYRERYIPTEVNESKLNRIVKECIDKALKETSTDTIDSAHDKAMDKVFNCAAKYGESDPRTIKAINQRDKFGNEWNRRYREGNVNRRANMLKNRDARTNGTREYVSGKGWRDKQDK